MVEYQGDRHGSGDRIAIVGGRGKTGRAIAAALQDRGCRAVALGRAESADPARALRGCAAVYIMAPNLHPHESEFVGTWLAAASQAGISRVVYHSVAAPYAPAMPHHLGKARAEDLVRRSGLDWTILQPCAYLDNLLPGLRADPPRIDVAYSPDAPFGMVALADVGAAAARVLTEPGHAGAAYELGGPGIVTVRRIADAASGYLGAVVVAARLAPDDWAAGPGAGLSERERDWLLAMFAYYDRYGLPAGSLATRALLGREPLDITGVLAGAGVPRGD